jgi:hypothetical protein
MPIYGNDFWYADFNTPTNVSVISATEATSIGDSLERLEMQVPIKVTSAAARNETFPNPQQGDSVYRLDLGFEERYYETYSVKTNLAGKPSAGWYRINSGPVTLANIDFQNTADTSNLFASVFDEAYKFYEIRYSIQTPTPSTLNFYLKNGTANLATALYRWSYLNRVSGGSTAGSFTALATFAITYPTNGTWHHGVILLSDVNPSEHYFPKIICRSYSSNNTSGQQKMFTAGCYQSTTQNVDGFLIGSANPMFGNVQVLGYS